jgi:hypothetical protein
MMAHDSLIDESVSQLKSYFTEILITKGIDKNATAAELFESFGDYLKAETAPTTAQAMFDRKRRAAERLAAAMAEREKEQLKKVEPMIDIFKLHNEQSVVEVAKSVIAGELPGVPFADVLMGHARLSKRAGESDAKAFTRLFENNIEFRQADAAAKEAGWIAHHKLNVMSVEPSVVGGAQAMDVNRATEAVKQLKELAAQQHKSFEQAMLENPELTARTYTSAHRPNLSSTSGSELQR